MGNAPPSKTMFGGIQYSTLEPGKVQNVVIAKNAMNAGFSAHVVLNNADVSSYLLLKNSYFQNQTNSVPAAIETSAAPVHIVE
jgi:hypothetical protein